MLPCDKDPLKEKIISALARAPLDYSEKLAFINEQRRQGEDWRPASVLLILECRVQTRNGEPSGCYFLLNKRSLSVQQPGDLCCPGGGSHPLADHILSYLLTLGFYNPVKGRGFQEARKRDTQTFRKIAFFLATALRESWEENRLTPFQLDFLGPLPCYQLNVFRRIVFPVVAMIEKEWIFKPNWEVERIVRLPLEPFFNRKNYAWYSLKVPEGLQDTVGGDRWEFPCFIPQGEEDGEVLWGATYHIIMSFLRLVYGFEADEASRTSVINGDLSPSYFICPGPPGPQARA